MKIVTVTAGIILAAALPIYLVGQEPNPPKKEKANRIICLVPSVTELLFEVDAGDQIVGINDYSNYPAEKTNAIEKVGGVIVNYEKILALKPDVIFSSEGLARKTNGDLRQLGLDVQTVDCNSFRDISEQLARLGELTGNKKAGKIAADYLLARVHSVEKLVAGKERPRVYIEVAEDPPMTAGPDSFVGDLVQKAGGRNIMHDVKEHWAVTPWEVVLARDPDIILIVHTQKELLKQRAGWQELRAVKTKRVYFVPREYFVYPTSRLARGLLIAKEKFHGKN